MPDDTPVSCLLFVLLIPQLKISGKDVHDLVDCIQPLSLECNPTSGRAVDEVTKPLLSLITISSSRS
ncbi:hypothetical protein IE53DRAFT_174648 [Violaceomyces palustris]|uniref:Uncharacterized protein n=1 Tax=Violaceomyces palustris TaxID=1673888 RepID=A0ACD0P5T1_9BASI|nr:hypothetical protein IE53DRAFT_174648 [Violaceomyces palustris]